MLEAYYKLQTSALLFRTWCDKRHGDHAFWIPALEYMYIIKSWFFRTLTYTMIKYLYCTQDDTDGLVQDCSNSIANALG